MKRTIISFVLVLLCVAEGYAVKKDNGIVKFNLYGSDVQVRFDASKRVKVKKATEAELNKCVTWLDANTSETLQDCLSQKQELKLTDWTYVKMLDKLSTTALGQSNEATLLMAGLLRASGYNTRVVRFSNGQLRALYQSDAFIYKSKFFTIDNKWYFLYGDTTNISDNAMITSIMEKNDGKMIDFRQNPEIRAVKLTDPRKFSSAKNPDFTFTVQVNQNLLDYYADMPTYMESNNFMTRWAFMANRPLDKHLQTTLIPEMKQKVKGMSQKDAVQNILWWVQTAFEYQYDEEIWGYDRAFYPEETLYYPFCDAEDRTILLSRLIRDVLGLDVVIIYYPGHLASAVCITEEEVKGAYAVLGGRYFVVCDPTYIGSNVGEEMPSMVGMERTLMLLK